MKKEREKRAQRRAANEKDDKKDDKNYVEGLMCEDLERDWFTMNWCQCSACKAP